MPKRSAEDKIAHYLMKIKRLQTKKRKNSKDFNRFSDSSDFAERSDDESNVVEITEVPEMSAQCSNTLDEQTIPEQIPALPDVTVDPPPVVEEASIPEPTLDPELLVALGEVVPEQVIYGDDIHSDLVQRWTPILKKGLEKEQKEKNIKEYAVPKNCKLFRAPLLNPEIAAAVSEFARNRDKKIENSQQQLGIGLTAISRALTTLLTSDDKVKATRCLSDASRLLSDLHATETQTRIKSLTQGLEKYFINIIQETQRDEMLFGSDLPEKIRASKAIEKQGSQIKKADLKATPSASTSRTTRPQGNWRGPSRSTNRGGRGGPKRTNQRAIVTAQTNFAPSKVWNKAPRAGPRM